MDGKYRILVRIKIYDKSACSITSTGVAVNDPHDPKPNLYLGGNGIKNIHKRSNVCSKNGFVLGRIEVSYMGN